VSSFNSAFEPFQAWWLLYLPPSLTFHNSTFCPHSCIMCFVWIWEQTAINPIQHFYNRDGECLLRGTDWIFIYTSSSRVGCCLRISPENSVPARSDSQCVSELQFLRNPDIIIVITKACDLSLEAVEPSPRPSFYFLAIHFNIMLPWTPLLLSCILSPGLPTKTL